MNWTTRIIIVLSVFGAGCEQNAPSPPAQHATGLTAESAQQQAASPAASQASVSEQPDDPSLTTAQYIKLGLPKCDRPWSSIEMGRAAKVLTEIAKRNAHELPRRDSPKSGDVFKRIVADDNLDSLRKKSLPISIRTGFALQFLHAVTLIGKLYGTLAADEGSFSDETTDIIGLTLRIAKVMKGLSDEVRPTLDKNNDGDDVRLKGLTQLTAALGPVLQGTINQALASKKLTPETRTRMLEYLDQTLPELVKVLSPDARKELRTKLETLSERPEFAEHQQRIRPLLDQISKPSEESSTNEPDQ